MLRKLMLMTAVTVALPAAAIDRYQPGSDSDPRVRSADFLLGGERYYSAATELLQILGDKPAQRLSPSFHRRLADATLNFGITQRAETIYRELAIDRGNALSVARARIQVAEYLYQRGRYRESIADLEAVRNSLPKEALLDWQDLMGRALLAQRRYGEAASVLTEIKDAGPQRAFTRYNLGVALVKDGRVAQGLSVLDRVGQIDAADDDELAIRDKANLVLGYHFLRQQQAGTAVNVFQRIRSEGPFSNRALLGLGWAYLAPAGGKQKKVPTGDDKAPSSTLKTLSTIGVLLRPGFLDDDIYKRAGLSAFRLTKASADEEEGLKRALVPWLELIARDPIDPAVQEGFLAIPYTLDRLGAHLQAQQYYEQAIGALEASRKRIDESIYYVKSGRMVSTMVRRTYNAESGWAWELKDLPDAEETYYLQSVIVGNRFQEQLKNYRDALLLVRSLEGWAKRAEELQGAWLGKQQPDVPTDVLVARRMNRAPETSASAPVVPTPAVTLRSSDSLNASGRATAAPAAQTGGEQPLPLQAASAPAASAFVGPFEKLEGIKTRVAVLLPQAKAISERQSRMIDKMAQDNLAEQRRLTEKYLIEARFALARVYDKQMRGEAP